jgi:histidinol-phosphate aminotransferase
VSKYFLKRKRDSELSSQLLSLDRNEYFFSHHPQVKNVFCSFTEGDLSKYASYQDQQNLRQLLCEKLQVDNKYQITMGHGAEDILVKSLSWLKNSYHSLILEDFSWTNYLHIAEGLNYQIHKFQSNYSNDRYYLNDEILKNQLKKFPKSLVLLTSPNNPTGHSVDFVKLIPLIEEFSEHIFLLDMVYAPLFSNSFSDLYQYKNVIIIGSFSKFFGMPGLRMGFAIGHLPSAFHLNLGMQKNSIMACKYALENISWYQKNRDEMLSYAYQVSQIKRKNIHIFQSEAPFFLAKLLNLNNLDAIFRLTEEHSGVKPKYISKQDIPYIRFGLGPSSICSKIDTYLSFFD